MIFKYVPLLLFALPFSLHASDHNRQSYSYGDMLTEHWIVILGGFQEDAEQHRIFLEQTKYDMRNNGFDWADIIPMEAAGIIKARKVLKEFDIMPKL